MGNSTFTGLQNRNKDHLLKSIESENKSNENTDLPKNIKADRQAKNIEDVTFMASKFIPIPRQDDKIDDDCKKRFENVPKT